MTSDYIEIPNEPLTVLYFLTEILNKEEMPMLTMDGLIAVISLCLTSFGLGYAIGYALGINKPQK